MARLIEADALLEKWQARHDFFVDGWGKFDKMPFSTKCRVDEITNCMADVVDAPTVDAVPVVHGRWIWNEENECWICSNCEMSALNNYRGNSTDSKYCPNCGATMDLEVNDA